MKERNISIDVLKCFAALLITNSHMGLLYGEYSFLSTGGCIGDVLFFFCSGFTLFLKPMYGGVGNFVNWYKRRISRIYPTMLAVALFACVFFDTHWDIVDIALTKRYWFVSCIMLYYIAIYFVGSYFKDKIFLISLLVAVGSGIWFYYICDTPKFSIYAGHHIRWLLFFVFMLLGAKMGTMTDKIKSTPIKDFLFLMLSIAIFYALFISGMRIRSIVFAQYFSFIPLLSAMYFFYKVGASKYAERLYKNKVGNFVIRFIGGLCLEIYMVQFFLFTDKMNSIFPLNILIMFVIIIVVAYLVRCLGRLISQTFKEAPYEWRKVIALY